LLIGDALLPFAVIDHGASKPKRATALRLLTRMAPIALINTPES
jgi:hypothetical protein